MSPQYHFGAVVVYDRLNQIMIDNKTLWLNIEQTKNVEGFAKYATILEISLVRPLW